MPANPTRRCLAKRRIDHRFTLASVLILALVATVACRPSSPIDSGSLDPTTGAKLANGAPAVFQPQGSGKVKLRIENRQRCELEFFRIVGNDFVAIELPQIVLSDESGESNSFEVDSGFYMVRAIGDDKQEVEFPVPAIAPFVPVGGLVERITPAPKSEPDWCWIPSGPAIIGDTLGVGREDERPAKIVELPSFWMGEKEITNRQYAAFLSSQKTIDEKWIDLRSRKCLIKESSEGAYAVDSDEADVAEKPVVMVSLAGALAYCRWRSAESGQRIRLPTEQEWEKAARGPESFVYSYGNIYKQSLANQESGKLKPVGSYSPNSFGLYDMTGNVFEWMSDKADPTNLKTTLNHSLRGGSFVLDGMYLRNSFRMRQSPTVMTDDIGFRIARDAGNESKD